MYKLLSEQTPDAVIDGLYFSPYHVEGVIEKYTMESPMRKPDIGMILEAQKKYDIDLSQSYFIGDTYDDIKCAESAGIKKILVKTGLGEISYRKCLDENLKIDFIAENLSEAVNFVAAGL